SQEGNLRAGSSPAPGTTRSLVKHVDERPSSKVGHPAYHLQIGFGYWTEHRAGNFCGSLRIGTCGSSGLPGSPTVPKYNILSRRLPLLIQQPFKLGRRRRKPTFNLK